MTPIVQGKEENADFIFEDNSLASEEDDWIDERLEKQIKPLTEAEIAAAEEAGPPSQTPIVSPPKDETLIPSAYSRESGKNFPADEFFHNLGNRGDYWHWHTCTHSDRRLRGDKRWRTQQGTFQWELRAAGHQRPARVQEKPHQGGHQLPV
mmetsp:Transcript_7986/g.20470  ORF Transcript_7986/g.20470 Transcript_7986/m.20470 type:complete len:151 (+) Transcript_7986:699-1151(+)